MPDSNSNAEYGTGRGAEEGEAGPEGLGALQSGPGVYTFICLHLKYLQSSNVM